VLASAGADGEIKLWDVEAGRCLATLDSGSGTLFGVRFLPDDRSLAFWGGDGRVNGRDLSREDALLRANEPFWRARLAAGARVP
jgi:WD40 repeat protein